jgi:predicted HD phosphohydrolase
MVFNETIMEPFFWVLEQNEGVMQHLLYHPEGDVFTHSLQALYIAFRETNDTDLILAAMLHDVGKAGHKLGHDKVAIDLLNCHCSAKTLWLIENHMRIWYFLSGEMRKLSKVKDLIGHPFLPELIHLARIDKVARNPNRRIGYDKQNIIDRLNQCVERRWS